MRSCVPSDWVRPSGVRTSLTWNQNFLIPQLPSFSQPGSHYLTVSTNAHTADNRFGSLYSFNFGTSGGCAGRRCSGS